MLVIVAVQRPDVKDSGTVPSAPQASPRPSASTPPPPTATAPLASLDLERSFLNMTNYPVGARVSPGDCDDPTRPAAVLELTTDGGMTWSPTDFNGIDVREILALDVVDSTQIDVVAATGAGCTVTLVSTFTSGQFWDVYPARLVEKTFVDPARPSEIARQGTRIASPCSAVLEVAEIPSGLAVVCAEGLFASDSTYSNWIQIGSMAPAGIAVDAADGSLFGVLVGADDCEGAEVTGYDGVSGALTKLSAGCLALPPAPTNGALAAQGGSVWFWSDSGLYVARPAATDWARVN